MKRRNYLIVKTSVRAGALYLTPNMCREHKWYCKRGDVKRGDDISCKILALHRECLRR